MPNDLDVRRLIEEVKARPIIWDVRYGEYKDRTNTPQKWAEIAASLGVDVEHCKRKWKNLRDAYRAEVRRSERRVERLKASGNYDSSMDVRSKWAYFDQMSFINDSRRPRYQSLTHKSEGEGSNGSHDDAPGFHSFCDIKMEPHHTTDEDEYEDDDQLLEQFENAATPQAVRRLSNSISVANAAEDAAIAGTSSSRSPNCKCSNRADDQVHFLENLEREEQSLMQSTRMDMTRDNSASHVGDSDYNFLVSFLPQMKRMSELQNLQFRAKMSELLLNIMTPQSPSGQLVSTSAQSMQRFEPQQARQQLQQQSQQQLQQIPYQQQPPQQALQQQQQQAQRGVIQCMQSTPAQDLLQLQSEQLQLQQDDQQMQQQRQPFTAADLMDADQLENSNLSAASEMLGDNSNNWP
ncbi:probable serine/threonine-protein kinase fhkB [Bactrocera tryoni]|uniref:probable serine/threonine-protein kinase fhkB n=1 Tax=Bactrocera tryoni TaxID=59916 RepID=UPI001A9A140A|nr:probable serine/threonine-protein kinase fhkB [Bactrocera tryoni]